MNITYAKELLEMLADGVDPNTGEVLSGNDSCNQPDVIRALHLAVTILEKAEKAEKRGMNLPENAGKPWTQEADDKLIEMFNQGYPNRDISGRLYLRNNLDLWSYPLRCWTLRQASPCPRTVLWENPRQQPLRHFCHGLPRPP